ncbi:hypothetical protein ACF1HU_36285 [Streptomyces olivaceus]|uniref:hypothetical protein n=1 Tax=Streptomyces olivaceus TaxID=47716 RepID=UPI0004CC6734|nr:hypothetical protein [Streptomyces olivaceus]MBZ6107949.1 hypothetical protein [Streptomyces olivaceus]
MMEILRRHDFEGPAWEVFIGVMQEEACDVVEAWIRSGRILKEARKKWRPVTALSPALRDVLRRDETARHDLAQDALLAGSRALRTVLRDGRWDPRQSDLKNTFINLVVCQFSTVAKTWAATQKYRTHEETTEPDPEQQDLRAADQFTAAEDWIDLDTRFGEERETVRAMIRLRATGMAPKDVADKLDLPYRSAEGIWRRFTTKARAQGSDGRPA